MLRRIFLAGLALVIAIATVFVAITFWALEWSDVAVLETRTADGSWRETRVWYVFDESGDLLVEAGSFDSPWLVDVRRDPKLRLEIDGVREDYLAAIRPTPDGHRDIRRRLRERYGLRDAWIATFFDVSTSQKVELTEVERIAPDPGR
jgi:hypothetical protein